MLVDLFALGCLVCAFRGCGFVVIVLWFCAGLLGFVVVCCSRFVGGFAVAFVLDGELFGVAEFAVLLCRFVVLLL